jgi:UDP-N-acetylglucosamine diphosphorylase/glucosamine-1-phosphate N-acetyltransferase
VSLERARLYLFDDATARRWAPFATTRPVGELLFGCETLRERAERATGVACAGHLSGSALAGFDEPGAPPGVTLDEVGTEEPRILLLSRVVLEAAASVSRADPGDGPARLTLAGRTVGWVIPAGSPNPPAEWLDDPPAAAGGGAAERTLQVEGGTVEAPWSIIARNPDRLLRDLERLADEDARPAGVHRVGTGILSLAEGADVEPGVVVDTRDGPVRLEAGARALGPARLTGPLWVGRDSTILGGSVGASSIGPVCKVHGEVAESVILGFSNKAHDGHLGHALLGRWVNLGAGTTNSDLKNNYGPVRVWTPEGTVDTGLTKVGCFLGDHVKTGIGTLLNTGAVVGAGSNVFGGAMTPTVVPPFSWGAGQDLRDYRLDRFLEVAERAMARRGEELTPGVRRILAEAWHASRSEAER